jgi:hypothetical protein
MGSTLLSINLGFAPALNLTEKTRDQPLRVSTLPEQLGRALNDGGIFMFCPKPWLDEELFSIIEDEMAKRQS